MILLSLSYAVNLYGLQSSCTRTILRALHPTQQAQDGQSLNP